MQNPIPQFRQSFIILKKQVICLKNWKLWQAPTTIEFNIFCWNFAQTSYLTRSTKGSFFILFRSWFINKNVKNLLFVSFKGFLIFENNSRSKQNKKNLEQDFVDIGK